MSILIKIDFILFFIFLLNILLLKYFEKDIDVFINEIDSNENQILKYIFK